MKRQQRKTGTLASSDKIDLQNLNYASMHYKFNSVLPCPARRWVRRLSKQFQESPTWR